MPLQTKEQGHIFAATFAQSSTPSTIRKSLSPFLRTASAAWYSGLSCAAIAYERGVKERTVVVEFEPRQSMPVEAFDGPGDPHQTPRDAALRECNGAARKYTERDWETLTAGTYAGCMTSPGQIP
jgi:hypothetical protein